MKYKYKNAGIAGKFRLLHKAHVELILRAMGYSETLHVFIVDVPQYKRYASVDALIATFEEIFAHLAFLDYQIHVINEELTGEAWDKKLLELVPDLEAMFDSKEHYENVLLQNEFIALDSDLAVSVTNIEQNIYAAENFALIAEEFKPLLTQKIVITGSDALEITLLIEKIRMYYDGYVINLSELDTFGTMRAYPKKIIMLTETIEQTLMSELAGFLDNVMQVIYFKNDDETVEDLPIPPAKFTEITLTTPETDFSVAVDTINRLLTDVTNKIEE